MGAAAVALIVSQKRRGRRQTNLPRALSLVNTGRKGTTIFSSCHVNSLSTPMPMNRHTTWLSLMVWRTDMPRATPFVLHLVA
jgi:hypothetical protein